MADTGEARDALSKVPAVTLGFRVVKIAATTLGETAGDTVRMTLSLGYLLPSVPLLATIIAATTEGTTMADFADRSLGIGYPGGAMLLLLACVLASLAIWKWTLGSVAAARDERGIQLLFSPGRLFRRWENRPIAIGNGATGPEWPRWGARPWGFWIACQ